VQEELDGGVRNNLGSVYGDIKEAARNGVQQRLDAMSHKNKEFEEKVAVLKGPQW